MDEAIAVFDVGKTNKKLMIYGSDFTVHDSVYRNFPTVQRDGVEVEPLEEIEEWLLAQLTFFASKYPIRAVSITTHGACFVCLGANGRPSLPVLSYTHEPEEELHDEFYDLAGSREELQKQTATYELKPLINPGKALYFLKKHYPREFEQTGSILFYPQYFGYFLTGEMAADFTYAGCHTYLWDFHRKTWSTVADALGVREMLPQALRNPWEILGTITQEVSERTGLAAGTIVTVGIHDSNASLLPYLLKKRDEDFTLNSTGTWCVAMHPMDDVYFADEEIGKAVFYNMSAFGQPVKTSILMGGMEFDTYTEILKSLNSVEELPEYNRALYQRIIREKGHFVFPSVVRGTGQFPESMPRVYDNGDVYSLEELSDGRRVPEFFYDYPAAYAVLNLSLAIQSRIALERVGVAPRGHIYTEGGFRNNPDYNALISAFFPHATVALTGMKEATSFGAALLARTALEQADIHDLTGEFTLSTQDVRQEEFAGVEDYVAEFMRLL